MNAELDKRSFLKLHFAVLLFGLPGILAKLIALPAVYIVLVRTVLGAISLYLVIRFRKESLNKANKKQIFTFVLLGFILAMHWLTFFYALKISTVSIAVLTAANFPMFVAFIEPIVFKNRINKKDIFLGLMVVAGTALLVPDFNLAESSFRGALWGSLSGFLFALLSVGNKFSVKSCSPLILAFYQNAFAAIVLLPSLFLLGRRSVCMQDIVYIIILGVVVTALAHTMYIDSMRRISAFLAGMTASLSPIYAIILAYLFLGEKVEVNTILGGLVILLACLFAVKTRDKKYGLTK